MDYLLVKWLHVVSSTVLFGTGVGSAFYLLFASRTRDARACAVVAQLVVVADALFTATTAVLQPLTGFYLVHRTGFALTTPWLLGSLVLYAVAIACWIPVVRLQILMRNDARAAAAAGAPLPESYFRRLRAWIALGIPAFVAFVAIFWLMVAKPA